MKFENGQEIKFTSSDEDGIIAKGVVLRPLTPEEADGDAGPMYMILLEGEGGLVFEWHAFEDELSRI